MCVLTTTSSQHPGKGRFSRVVETFSWGHGTVSLNVGYTALGSVAKTKTNH